MVDVIRFRVPHDERDAQRYCVDTWDQGADNWGGKQSMARAQS